MRRTWTVPPLLLVVVLTMVIVNLYRVEAQKTIDKNFQMFQQYYEEQAEETEALQQENKRLYEHIRFLEQEIERGKEQQQLLREEIEDLNNSFEGIFMEQARLHGLDPALVWAVVKQESGGRPDVTNLNTNGTRDHGLMQLNDGGTAQWLWKNVFPDEPFSIEALYCPENNMKLGMWLLAYLDSKYESKHAVLTAYNRGEGGLNSLIAARGSARSSYSVKVLSRME